MTEWSCCRTNNIFLGGFAPFFFLTSFFATSDFGCILLFEGDAAVVEKSVASSSAEEV